MPVLKISLPNGPGNQVIRARFPERANDIDVLRLKAIRIWTSLLTTAGTLDYFRVTLSKSPTQFTPDTPAHIASLAMTPEVSIWDGGQVQSAIPSFREVKFSQLVPPELVFLTFESSGAFVTAQSKVELEFTIPTKLTPNDVAAIYWGAIQV